MRKQRTSMRDVARNAGVSVSAVSLVVNGKAGVSPEIRERVWEVISELGYRTGMPTDKGGMDAVALLIENSSMPIIFDAFYGEVIRGFQTEAQRLGYQVMLTTFDRTAEYLDELRSGLASSVKGVVIAYDGE